MFKILALPVAALLLAIAVYDFHTTIIPDIWVGICGVLTLLVAFWGASSSGLSLIPVLFAGPIVSLPLFALWLVSKGTWMGLGDPKLALSLGWLLGMHDGLVAVFFAFVLGAVISIPLLFFSSEAWKRILQGFTQTPIVSLPLFFRKRLQTESRSAGTENDDFIPSDGKKTKTPLVYGFTMKSEIPFGPFLVASCFIVWFAQMYAIPLPFYV